MPTQASKWAHDLLDKLAQVGLTGESIFRWYKGGIREGYKIIFENKDVFKNEGKFISEETKKRRVCRVINK